MLRPELQVVVCSSISRATSFLSSPNLTCRCDMLETWGKSCNKDLYFQKLISRCKRSLVIPVHIVWWMKLTHFQGCWRRKNKFWTDVLVASAFLSVSGQHVLKFYSSCQITALCGVTVRGSSGFEVLPVAVPHWYFNTQGLMIYSKILFNNSRILPLLPKIKYEINPYFIVT